ncbi:MAG TPA: hypothetical protein VGJ00_10420 [Rhabdochlamydiaceae bacterium]|jgi:hypothetical protein
MKYTTNHFKKFLIDEIIKKSNASAKDALREVNNFSMNDRFNHTYNNWVLLQKQKDFVKIGRPKLIKEILSGLFQ